MTMKTLSTILVATIGLTLATAVGAAENSALAQPVKSVFDYYMKIQTALAKESMDGVGDEATNIVKALEGAAGDVLRCVNERSKETFEGIVQTDGVVVVQ